MRYHIWTKYSDAANPTMTECYSKADCDRLVKQILEAVPMDTAAEIRVEPCVSIRKRLAAGKNRYDRIILVDRSHSVKILK